MCTATRTRKPPRPAVVTCRWLRRLFHNGTDPKSGCLELNGQFYGVIALDGGGPVTGYRLVKADNTTYDVPADLGSCECLGFLRWGHCKHVNGLRALLSERLAA